MQHSICIPGVPPVEVSELYRIIDAEPFQALRERKQLGVNSLIFPGAVHTRFEHSIGVLSLTQRLCRIHGITGSEALHLQAFALLHDIGHGPFSHQTEPVLQGGHHHQGLKIIARLSPLLKELGLDPFRLCQMIQGTDPLGAWISDRNLGADKLDYLSRDALHIGFFGTPDIERIQYYTVMTPDGLAIEDKFTEEAKQLQKFYTYLHQHGYLNKTALIAQRMLQRACQERLALEPERQAECWGFTDSELISFLADGASPLATQLTNRIKRRELYRTFLVIKPNGYAYMERESNKPIQVREWDEDRLYAFCEKCNDLGFLSELEDRLSAEFGLPPGSVLFAAMPYFSKLIPKDLRVHCEGGEDYWLFAKDVAHCRSLASDYLRTFSVRLACPLEQRERLAALTDIDF